ncbi:hypothetical protein IE53DRAFT_314199 [Violaceomyces palustris]|uniref:Uncharacterized protein n=1 Tax=Violaceomyces palustris TaxID=1673888 RepID=A0ACD0NZS5_9BASI|nr:hypothetical protein IE53DRAFT_314199 [Violaceomyces palustris]
MHPSTSSENAGELGDYVKPPWEELQIEPYRLVVDADEEVFYLYTQVDDCVDDRDHAVTNGLGYVDASSDRIILDLGVEGQTLGILQNTTSLRTTKGDTGSIVWRASIMLARAMYERKIFTDLSFFSWARVLELGAGTGAFSLAMSKLGVITPAQASMWLCTDQEAVLPLLAKNLKGNSLRSSALDWNDFSSGHGTTRWSRETSQRQLLKDLGGWPDLIVCTDCVYNPGLFQALVSTLLMLTKPGKTSVLMACELRSSDIMSDFLSVWMRSDDSWKIVSLEGRLMKTHALWLGWRV